MSCFSHGSCCLAPLLTPKPFLAGAGLRALADFALLAWQRTCEALFGQQREGWTTADSLTTGRLLLLHGAFVCKHLYIFRIERGHATPSTNSGVPVCGCWCLPVRYVATQLPGTRKQHVMLATESYYLHLLWSQLLVY